MTPAPRPLAEASERLRGKPGRPRTAVSRVPQPPRAEVMRTSVRPAEAPEPAQNAAPVTGAPPAVADLWLSWPRVLTLEQAAKYLAVSAWTLRELRAAGHVPKLAIPGLRVLRFDRVQLDRVVDAWSAEADR